MDALFKVNPWWTDVTEKEKDAARKARLEERARVRSPIYIMARNLFQEAVVESTEGDKGASSENPASTK